MYSKADEGRKPHMMIAGYIAARDDAEDLRWVAEWLLTTGVEECGITGVEAQGDCPDLKVGRDTTSFD